MLFYRVMNRSTYSLYLESGDALPFHGEDHRSAMRYSERYNDIFDYAKRSGVSIRDSFDRMQEISQENLLPIGSAPFWDRLCERVRAERSSYATSRYQVVFAFDTIGDAETYYDSLVKEIREAGDPQRGKISVICEVYAEDALPHQALDMNFINQLDETQAYSEAAALVENYWNGEHSEAPLMETLLEGAVRVGPLVRTFSL